MTKLTADQFKRITGWQGRTNEHARDAAMMIWQMIMGVIMGLIPYGEKGRPIGENHGFARWSDEIVEKVRDMHEHQKVRASEIRKLYNIPKSTLSYILNYKSRAVTPVSWKPKKEKTKDGVTSA